MNILLIPLLLGCFLCSLNFTFCTNELNDFTLYNNLLLTQKGIFGLQVDPSSQFLQLALNPTLPIEKNYLLMNSAKKIVITPFFETCLLNGFNISCHLVGDQTLNVQLSYSPEKDFLSHRPFEYIHVSHPVEDDTRKGELKFYRKDTKSTLCITVPRYLRIFRSLSQHDATGDMPGPVGSVLIFIQDTKIYVLKKIRSDSLKILVCPESLAPRIVALTSPKKHPLPRSIITQSRNDTIIMQQCLGVILFIGVMVLLVKYIKGRIRSRRIRRRHRNRQKTTFVKKH